VLVLDVCARTCAEERGCAVPGRGLGMAGGVGLSAVRRARRPSLRPSTVVRRAARSCAVWRVAQRLPTALRPPAKHSRRARRGPRPATSRRRPRRSRPAPGAAAPTPGAPGRTGNSILAKMVQGPFCFRGDHRSAHAPASLFGARQRLRTRTSAVCCLVCVSLDLAAISRPDLPCCNAHLRGSPSHTRSVSGQTSQHTSPCCPVAAVSAARPASDAC